MAAGHLHGRRSKRSPERDVPRDIFIGPTGVFGRLVSRRSGENNERVTRTFENRGAAGPLGERARARERGRTHTKRIQE